jgi:hypothetical protein
MIVFIRLVKGNARISTVILAQAQMRSRRVSASVLYAVRNGL